MAYPTHEQLCDRLRAYFDKVHAWQTRRLKNIDDLLAKHPDIPKDKRPTDPPPKPPDLGP